MKKTFIILLAGTIFAACSSDHSIDSVINNDETNSLVNNLNHRSYSEVIEIAQNSINMLQSNSPVSRGAEPMRTLNLKSGVKAILQPISRSSSSALDNDTLLYIVNFNDNLGFAVISASRQTEGLIAVTESGSYDPAVKTENAAFETYMQMAKAYVDYEDKASVVNEATTNTRSSSEITMCKPVYDTIFYKRIEPKVTVRWGQNKRMGQYCPYLIAGCGNTAMAQIMSYFKYPNSLTLTFPEKDVNSTILDWTAMCNHIYSDSDANRDEADKQIGRLARQLGELSGSKYYSTYTSSNIEAARSTMQSLGYSVSDVTDYNEINPDEGYPLANALAAGKLIYMGGEKNSGVGHAWVIDGCLYVKALHKLMATYDGVNWFVYQDLGTYRTCHNHINWGFDGVQNGYFLSSVLNVYNVLQADPCKYYIADGHNYNYNINVSYFSAWH